MNRNRHGNMNLSWHKEILVAEIEGAFNEEGLEYWFPKVKQLIENRKIDTWYRLEIWDEEVLGSPETIEHAKAMYEWYEENGCLAIAVVVCNRIQEQIITAMFQSQAKIFRNKDEAIQWLENKLD
jgi:hypothetical protein